MSLISHAASEAGPPIVGGPDLGAATLDRDAPPVLGAGGASVVSCGALALLLLGWFVAPEAVRSAAPVLAVVGLLIGVPHGAVDHVMPAWLAGLRPTPRDLTPVIAQYVALATAAAVSALLLPDVAIGLFLVASALHFGRGEVAFAAERVGRRTPTARSGWLVTLAHGSVVVALPFALWHDETGPLLATLAPVIANPPELVLTALVASTAVLCAAAVLVLVARGRLVEAAELSLVVVTFAVVPPLAAFGVYFAVWHAGRHTCRLLGLAAGSDIDHVRSRDSRQALARAARRYAAHAAVPTLVALTLLVLVASTEDRELLTAEIAVLLALTFPHLRAVASLDAARAALR